MYDVTVRNGTIIDGTGLAPYRADVGIRDGVIAKIGVIPEPGTEELDASGHVVTPGFIEGHTHMDAQVFWDQLGSCSCWHGVTTAVMGHCGFTLAPAAKQDSALVVRNLERAEDIAPAALAAGIDWNWTTFAEYVDAVDRLPKGINYAANIGHSALRTFVMRERAFTDTATQQEIDAMASELRDALRAGAFGLSTSRSAHHMTSDDKPVASRLADWDEVRQLTSHMSRLGAGMLQITDDSPGAGQHAARAERDARFMELALNSGVPIAIVAIHAGAALELIDEAAASGGRLFGLAHPRGITSMCSFRSHLPFDRLPEWQPVRGLPWDDQAKALRDPATRKQLVEAAHTGEYGSAVGAEARRPDYDKLFVMHAPIPPYRTVADLAGERGVDPVELMIDMALETDFHQFFIQPVSWIDEDEIVEALSHPRTVMAFSDAGAHVSQISDCSVQTHLLAYWVRERKAFSLPEAVRMLTLQPARAWGIHDRGLLREGLCADINVFDADTVGPAMPYIDHDLPAGEPRIKQQAVGFLATLVNGEITYRNGEHTGALPGTLLRGPLAAH